MGTMHVGGMWQVTLGKDPHCGAVWSAAFGQNRDGECFMMILVNENVVSTVYDHESFPGDDAELRAWAAEAIRARAASWTQA